MIDSKLSWDNHIDVICHKVAKSISIMNRVRYSVNSQALYTLYCSLVMPYVSYAAEVWGNACVTKLGVLCRPQKRQFVL